jgi:hypothetical protein
VSRQAQNASMSNEFDAYLLKLGETPIANFHRFPRHRLSSTDYRSLRSEAMNVWREIAGVCPAAYFREISSHALQVDDAAERLQGANERVEELWRAI